METLLLICAISVNCSLGDVTLVVNLEYDEIMDNDINYGLEVKKVTAYEVIKNKEKYSGCVVVATEDYLKIED